MELQTTQVAQPSSTWVRPEESARRDSLSSNRTRDSGYNSDPDTHSPLEFSHQDSDLALASYCQHPIPSLTVEYIDIERPICAKTARIWKGAYESILGKKYGEGRKTALRDKLEVTSNPAYSPVTSDTDKPIWTGAFKDSTEPSFRDQIKTSKKEGVELWIDDFNPPHNRPKERVASIVSLSSTSSADMYSVTEDDEDDEVHEIGVSVLSKATLKTIELIMRKIEVNLAYAAYMQCAGGQSSRRPSGSGESSRNTGRGGTGQAGAAKRKSRTDESTPSENPDDDGPTKRRRVSIATTEDSEPGPRFACPFYKHDPNRYRNRRTCPGPGWPTVHRMKEHLYRAHAQPIFCPRCYTMFDSDSEFSVHLRSDPCQISVPQPIDGIDRETLFGLRKRSPALRLEEDKWRDTYQLLFPGVPTSDIPSPYYDNNAPSEESRRFRRALLERIRSELFATAEHETDFVEQRLLRQVADIIQRCENDLLASFHTVDAHQQPSQSTPARQLAAPDPFSPNRRRSAPTSLQDQTRHASAASTHAQHYNNVPTTAPSQLLPEPHYPIPFDQTIWDDPHETPLSEWIDWNAVFLPGTESHAQREETLPRLTTTLYT